MHIKLGVFRPTLYALMMQLVQISRGCIPFCVCNYPDASWLHPASSYLAHAEADEGLQADAGTSLRIPGTAKFSNFPVSFFIFFTLVCSVFSRVFFCSCKSKACSQSVRL